MHYLITGHTGFKGSWLSLILQLQGHEVSGIGLDAPQKSLFNQAKLGGGSVFKNDYRLDIRNVKALHTAIKDINPEVIIHLAAQPLVREAYRIPVETFEINVIGTLNVLEATRELQDLKSVLIVTTDKVYKDNSKQTPYVESDPLGGSDPYSASKAAADIAAQSWIKNYAQAPMAIVRSGNVIGGGDWSSDRIIPDLVTAFRAGERPTLRYPNAVRPWQHVLDCLNGYLELIDKQINFGWQGAWNFGPNLRDIFRVSDVAEEMSTYWGYSEKLWAHDHSPHPNETEYLFLNSSKARSELGWNEKYDFKSTIQKTAEWYLSFNVGNIAEITREQVRSFIDSPYLLQ